MSPTLKLFLQNLADTVRVSMAKCISLILKNVMHYGKTEKYIYVAEFSDK